MISCSHLPGSLRSSVHSYTVLRGQLVPRGHLSAPTWSSGVFFPVVDHLSVGGLTALSATRNRGVLSAAVFGRGRTSVVGAGGGQYGGETRRSGDLRRLLIVVDVGRSGGLGRSVGGHGRVHRDAFHRRRAGRVVNARRRVRLELRSGLRRQATRRTCPMVICPLLSGPSKSAVSA